MQKKTGLLRRHRQQEKTDHPDPQYLDTADYVVMECTYGDRLHQNKDHDHEAELAGIIQETLDRGGNVVIPAFAVWQNPGTPVFYPPHQAAWAGEGAHGDFPVYVDSPLAVEATHVFNQNLMDCYDEETEELVRQGINPISFKGLKLSITSDESKNINFDETPKVIISGRRHVRRRPDSPSSETQSLAAGVRGGVRRLPGGGNPGAGADRRGPLGEDLRRGDRGARPHEQIEGISGHADRDGLVEWITAFKEKPRKVFLVHGDDEVCDILRRQSPGELSSGRGSSLLGLRL